MPAYRLSRGGVHAGKVLLAAVVAICASAPLVEAESVRVLAAGAAQGAIHKLEPALMVATGHTLEAVFDTVGALRDRVLAGEKADVVIVSEAGMAALEKAGKIVPGASVDLGSIAVALAVRKGAPVPDVASSPEALKRTLLAAKSIAHADPARGATAGTHFARVLGQLGIAGEIQPRITVLGFGGDVVEGVAQGRFEIGVSQASEIVAHAGVTLAGSLPAPYDHRTRYVAAKPAGAGPQADAFLKFLQEPVARAAFGAIGFEATR